MKWEEGRQKTGYFKMKLFESKWFKFDIYLLKYPEGSYIKPHIDEAITKVIVNGVTTLHEHHRLNIVLKNAGFGGYFCINEKSQQGRFHYFRPDLVEHAVTTIHEGTRYALSIGWNKIKKV